MYPKDLQLLLDKNDWVGVENYVNTLQKPLQQDIKECLAWSYSRQEKYCEAIVIYDELLSDQPNNAKWLYSKGYQYYAQKDYKNAIIYFEEALTVYPNYLKVKYRVSYAYIQLAGNERQWSKDVFWKAISHLKSAHEIYKNLSIDEQRIYELIARQYLLQFCPDAEYRKSKITLSIEGGTFVAQARNLQTAGWKELLGKEDEDENQEPLLPIVKKGQILYCERGEVVSKKTQPPKPFTDATLLSAMTGIARFVQDKELKKILRETDGLGTEATRAGIIELLFKRGFLTKKGRNIHSTETGRILISALPDIATQPDMTAHWEAQLTDISQKQATYQQFMFTLNQMLPDLVRFVDFTALRRLSQISKGLNAAPAKRKRAVKKLEDLNAEN